MRSPAPTLAWEFVVPGQPPSVNHMYVRVRGQWNKQAKAPGIEQYQQGVALICRAARPSGWKATNRVRISFGFDLKRDADCDNLLKVILDAVATALGCNDRIFLPCVLWKTSGNANPSTTVQILALPTREASPSSSPERTT